MEGSKIVNQQNQEKTQTQKDTEKKTLKMSVQKPFKQLEQAKQKIQEGQNLLKLYIYGSCESDQFRHPAKLSESKRPICLSNIPKFDLKQDSDKEDEDENGQNKIIENPVYKKPIYKIACGGLHSVILTTDGKAYTFGCNDQGALGRSGPECVPLEVKLQNPVDLISAGDNHTMFANSVNGILYFTGNYNYLRGEKMRQSITTPRQFTATSLDVRNRNQPIQKLVSGANHTCILVNRKIFCRGQPQSFTTGRRINERRKTENSLTFDGVGLNHVLDVWCGGYHSIAKVKQGKQFKYFTWGKNDQGQLGIGTFESQAFPVQIHSLKGKNVIKVGAGAFFNLFLTDQGQIYGCGSNEYGQLGLGEDYEFVPSDIESQEEQELNKIQQKPSQLLKNIAVAVPEQGESQQQQNKDELNSKIENLKIQEKGKSESDANGNRIETQKGKISEEIKNINSSDNKMQVERDPARINPEIVPQPECKDTKMVSESTQKVNVFVAEQKKQKAVIQSVQPQKPSNYSAAQSEALNPKVQPNGVTVNGNLPLAQPANLGQLHPPGVSFNNIVGFNNNNLGLANTGSKKKYEEKNTYIKSIRKLEFSQQTQPSSLITDLASGAGSEFSFAWNKNKTTELYSWGFGMNYVLLNGQQNQQYKPFKVRNKIFHDQIIQEMAMGGQHVLYTAYQKRDGKKPNIKLQDEVQAIIASEKKGKLSRKKR